MTIPAIVSSLRPLIDAGAPPAVAIRDRSNFVVREGSGVLVLVDPLLDELQEFVTKGHLVVPSPSSSKRTCLPLRHPVADP